MLLIRVIREDSECEEASRQALPAAGAIGSADSRNARRDAESRTGAESQ